MLRSLRRPGRVHRQQHCEQYMRAVSLRYVHRARRAYRKEHCGADARRSHAHSRRKIRQRPHRGRVYDVRGAVHRRHANGDSPHRRLARVPLPRRQGALLHRRSLRRADGRRKRRTHPPRSALSPRSEQADARSRRQALLSARRARSGRAAHSRGLFPALHGRILGIRRRRGNGKSSPCRRIVREHTRRNGETAAFRRARKPRQLYRGFSAHTRGGRKARTPPLPLRSALSRAVRSPPSFPRR